MKIKLHTIVNNFVSQLFLGQYRTKETKVGSALKKQNTQLKQMWKGENYPDFGIERLVRLFCAMCNYIFPTLYIRWIAGKYGGWLGRKMAMDMYTILNFLLPIIALACDWHTNKVAVLICVYFSIATISYIINLVVLEPEYSQPGSYLRSVICFGFNFLQIIACFAILYRYIGVTAWNGINEYTFDALHAFYYSFIVSTTIGFGDIVPISNSAIWLTICQAFISLLFLYVILTKFIAHIGERTYANESKRK